MTKKWHHVWSWYTAFSFYVQILKTWQGDNDGHWWKNYAIWWNIKIKLQKLVDICGYELPTNCNISRKKTYSLTAALDQLRVVASSTSNDPGPRSRQQIGQCLLPLAAANFSVADPAGASSQQREECRCGLLLTVAVPTKQVCSPVGDSVTK